VRVNSELRQELTKLGFDSTKPVDDKNPLDGLLRKVVDAEVTVKLEVPSMTVKEISGLDEALKAVPEEQRAAVGQFLNKESLTRLAQASFPALPDKKGDKKEMSGVVKATLGAYDTKITVTNDGAVDKYVRFTVKTDWTFKPAADATGPFKIVSIEPVAGTSEGEITFNSADGQVQSSKLVSKIKGAQVKLTLGDQKVDAELTQTDTTTVETVGK
jgi:translation initiation factor IF-1